MKKKHCVNINPPIYAPGTVLHKGKVVRVEEPCKPITKEGSKS